MNLVSAHHFFLSTYSFFFFRDNIKFPHLPLPVLLILSEIIVRSMDSSFITPLLVPFLLSFSLALSLSLSLITRDVIKIWCTVMLDGINRNGDFFCARVFRSVWKKLKNLNLTRRIVSKVGRKESSKRNIQELHMIGVQTCKKKGKKRKKEEGKVDTVETYSSACTSYAFLKSIFEKTKCSYRKVSFSLPIFQRKVVSISVIVWKRVWKLLVNFIHKHITESFGKNYEKTGRRFTCQSSG